MNSTHIDRQKGLSLIELMVATAVSMLLLLGVLQVFLSSKTTYSTNTALARVQESGRFAAEFLAYDIRSAGYKGECIGTPINHLDETSSAYNADLFDMSNPIKGVDNGTDYPSIAERTAGTDILILKHTAKTYKITVRNNNQKNSNTIGIENSQGDDEIPDGAIIIAASPSGCDIFQKNNNGNANTLTRGQGESPGNKRGNSSLDWSQAHNGNSQILQLQSSIYYIRNGASGVPSLWRASANQGTLVHEELVEGVVDMQILYGIDTSLISDREADKYVKAGSSELDSNAKWERVVSVRVDLLAISPETNVTATPQKIAFAGANGITRDDAFITYTNGVATIKGNRIAQAFTHTIGIRNRLP